MFDRSGNLYGATEFGGGKGTTCDSFYQYCGAVFELSPPKKEGGKWTEKVLHGFAGGSDGAEPNGSLVFDDTGIIYGTTYFGGSEKGACSGGVGGTGCGTVFALHPSVKKDGVWSEKVLRRFNIQDGDNPAAGVIRDRNGVLFGTTFAGPQDKWGLIFELKKPSRKAQPWTETMLYVFGDRDDGASPMAGLAFNANGDLYGVATGGGVAGDGTLFRLRRSAGSSWAFAALHGFTGQQDGSYPASSLIFDKTGIVYGTTQQGGDTGGVCGNRGCGTVFEVSP